MKIAVIFAVVGLCVANGFQHPEHFDPEEYMCSVCMNVYDRVQNKQQSFPEACAYFNACEQLQPIKSIFSGNVRSDSRQACEKAEMCPGEEGWQSFRNTDDGNLNLRVSKAYGARGNEKVRVSVISNSSLADDIFTYSEPFKFRWTQYYLNTGVVDVVAGTKNQINIGSQSISVYVPKQDEGSRGVIIADPCFQSQWINCAYKDEFDTFNRTTALLNALSKHDDTHYWMVLGDNFYDQTGDASETWFSALSMDTKSKIMGSVPGNHDYWVHGDPQVYVQEDQLGNGFMQFYGQDVAASFAADSEQAEGADPFDFTVDPDAQSIDEDLKNAETLPPLTNFFYYNQIGNTAFIGYSGAYSFKETVPHFEEACAWAADVDADVVLLLGHWNGKGGMGCGPEMAVGAAYHEISHLDACKPIADKLRYVEGHTHCNLVDETDVGFMVAGQGMSGCGNFGFPVFDSTNGEFNVYYFPVQQAESDDDTTTVPFDNYDAILECFEANGVSGCYDMATKWATASLVVA